jgi:hypothetical protein
MSRRARSSRRGRTVRTYPNPSQFEFWVAYGDSEMSGIAPATGLPADYKPGGGALWRMGADRSWRKAAEPMSDESRALAPFPGVGLCGLFAHYRQQRVGGQVGIVVCSRIGAASDQWNQTSDQIYQTMLTRVRSAIAFGGTFRGFILADGANDGIGGLATWDTNHTSCRTNLFAAVPAANKPVVYYQLPVTKPTTAVQANWDAVRALQDGWQAADRIMVTGQDAGPWITGGGNLGVHMTAAGFVILAQAFDAAAAAL